MTFSDAVFLGALRVREPYLQILGQAGLSKQSRPQLDAADYGVS